MGSQSGSYRPVDDIEWSPSPSALRTFSTSLDSSDDEASSTLFIDPESRLRSGGPRLVSRRRPVFAKGYRQQQTSSITRRASLLANRCGRLVAGIARAFLQLSYPKMFLFVAFLFLGGYVSYLWRAEAALHVPWVPDAETRRFSERPLPPPREQTGISSYTLPLRTQGRNIVDEHGRRFQLLSVNWYGASDELFIPGGLDIRHRNDIASTIRRMGFNSVRLPYSDELVVRNPSIMPHLLAANPDLVGLRALDIFEACVAALTNAGIAVILNNHITQATWCCGADPCDAGWSNDHLGPLCPLRQTEEDWIRHWEELMARFVDDPLVVGADLRNEVRGVWGTMTWDRWAAAAELAGNRLLKINPDWLIIVGGTESGNDLSGVARRPVTLDIPDRVVYSSHVYAWSGWGSLEGRFSKRDYASFVRTMRHNWAYLVEGDEAPVWVGEFGASRDPGVGTMNYWQNLLKFLKLIDADFGYWAINPRKPKDNAKEWYALVEDDWTTPIVDYRMKDMTEIMGT